MAKVHLIAAARPNFMKIAPLYHALAATDWCEPVLIHTGQHYDKNMSDAFFEDLGMPRPHFHLNVGSGTHAEQTGGVMIEYEKIAMQEKPDWIVVVGDVNSTVACALVGAKLWIPVAHLEAGLRSGDLQMPEEINRIVTDRLANVLWTPSEDGNENLLNEGTSKDRIDLVGNIMIDSFELMREQIEQEAMPDVLGIDKGSYGVVTMHRPSNVDDEQILCSIVEQLVTLAQQISFVFPVHPRTKKQLEEFGLYARLVACDSIRLIEPIGYIQFMSLVSNSALVITDSGGIQEETTYLGIPCLTLRENTERPITITQGTNELVRAADLQASVSKVLAGKWKQGSKPHLWDGKTASRVAESLKSRL